MLIHSTAQAPQREIAIEVSLIPCLKTVLKDLSLTLDRTSNNVECLHQLRVATKRSLVAFKHFRMFLSKKHSRWLRQKLRRIRQRTGNPRDLDMLIAKHRKNGACILHGFHRGLRRRRMRAQKRLEAYFEKLIDKGLFARRMRKVVRAEYLAEVQAQTILERIKDNLNRMLERFECSMPMTTRDPSQLHRFRLRVKELRYSLEFLTGIPKSPLPLIKELQDRLGEINDQAIYTSQLKRYQRTHNQKKIGEQDHLVRDITDVQLQCMIDSFFDWWTPQLQSQLRESLRALGKIIAQSNRLIAIL